VFVEGPIDDRRSNLKPCAMILAGTYKAPLSAELTLAEEHATIMTPLMWSSCKASRTDQSKAAALQSMQARCCD
jgi:hypothetical protein